MDSAAQAEGEKRVRDCLFGTLAGLGIIRPTGVKIDEFDGLQREVAQRLAYMGGDGLALLAEEIIARPDGVSANRMWSAPRILKRAAEIEPPSDTSSPLLRAVFAADLGQRALQEGFAPELRKMIREQKKREWPGPWLVKQAEEKAQENLRRIEGLKSRIAAGLQISEQDQRWMDLRQRAEGICRELAQKGAEA